MVTSVNLQCKWFLYACLNDSKQKLAMKEMKDEQDTCNGYFGEPPVLVTTHYVSQ